MDFWTSVTITVIVIVLGNVRNKANIGFQANRVRKVTENEIGDLKQRVNELETYSKKGIEKRLQAVETIVVGSDYHLNTKFKELLEDEKS